MKKTSALKTVIERINSSFKANDDHEVEDKDYFYLFVICVLIGISLANIILRLVMNTYVFSEWMEYFKDIDYRIFIGGMENGLFNFYDEVEGFDYPPYYLYFWYFIFFPFYILPFGIYIWDIFRIILTAFTIKRVSEVFTNTKDEYMFYFFVIFGYAIDAFHNNTNFLITFLLLESYIFLNKNKKWISGGLFALSIFKINSIIFLPLLLIIRKIDLKDLKYYLVPMAIIWVPYFIFPSYLQQMLSNWVFQEQSKPLHIIDAILWKALQPPHLFFIALMILIFLGNIKNEKWRNILRIVLPTVIITYMIRLIIILNVPT